MEEKKRAEKHARILLFVLWSTLVDCRSTWMISVHIHAVTCPSPALRWKVGRRGRGEKFFASQPKNHYLTFKKKTYNLYICPAPASNWKRGEKKAEERCSLLDKIVFWPICRRSVDGRERCDEEGLVECISEPWIECIYACTGDAQSFSPLLSKTPNVLVAIAGTS